MKAEHTQEPRGNVAYLMFILGVSVVAVILMIVEAVAPLTPGTRAILDYSDTALCAVFFIDFLITLASTSKKLRYLRSWGVLDLVSCVPMLSAFRVGRLARVVRILRLLRGVRSARILASALMKHRAQSTFSLAALVSILLLVFGSIAILQFEDTLELAYSGPCRAFWRRGSWLRQAAKRRARALPCAWRSSDCVRLSRNRGTRAKVHGTTPMRYPIKIHTDRPITV